ncbi:hypothetical protein A2115_01085 [Candidatus Woesebacteria bacterium GWA1_41_8]|jgi:large subunit ribosomal protein L25|uniref:Large ribosomal subunit protein bL25 n=1 Tax=Candidatus Woesebacteria bacterium GWA1_41_8 TaxID=1802471 RepID=A0A1F7WID3_9BACT|nr:MAG: hypothetical protein A2115_01085 [Candidatus Woesebacteria bacterium GWA1_41_8]
MKTITLKAEQRKLTGRKVKRLRKDGILPANIFGKNEKSQSLQVDLKQFEQVFKQAGETNLVELMVGSKKTPTLIHNIQTDPVSDIPLHVDFLQVNLKEKVVAQVPVELVGESPAEKQGLGTAVQYIDEVEVEALPQDLPDQFEVDLSKLTEVDQFVAIKDLKVASGVEVKNDKDQIIVKVEQQREEEEVEVVAPEAVGEEGADVATAGGSADQTSEEKSPEEPKKEE